MNHAEAMEMSMSIHDQLYQLFLLDKRVRGMRSHLDSAQRRAAALRQKLDDLNQQKSELQDKRAHVQARAANLEGSAKDVEERIRGLRERMNNVKSNKEYSAILVEVNSLKLEQGKLEEQALEQMNEAENLGEQLKDLDGRIADQQVLVNNADREVEQARAEVGEELDELTRQRDAAAEQLPPDTRRQFNRLSEAYDGESMAAIEEVNRRRMEYNCGGCYMQVPVESVSALLSGTDQVKSCPSCNRILFVEEQLRTSLSTNK